VATREDEGDRFDLAPRAGLYTEERRLEAFMNDVGV